jgi:hypothetical protein
VPILVSHPPKAAEGNEYYRNGLAITFPGGHTYNVVPMRQSATMHG